MNFSVGDIPFFKEYLFTDTGKTARHFALVLLPSEATQYRNSIHCCVITSKKPTRWYFVLVKKNYVFFNHDSFACFNRKDLVPLSGIDKEPQPKGKLNQADLKEVFKVLKKSLFVIKDIANDPFLRGTIIYEWKRVLNKKSQ